jgi:hypothetical protein
MALATAAGTKPLCRAPSRSARPANFAHAGPTAAANRNAA